LLSSSCGESDRQIFDAVGRSDRVPTRATPGRLAAVQTEGLVHGAGRSPEQHQLVVVGSQLVPGPGRDGCHVVAEQFAG
jgi:hypothetical protein